MVQIHQGIRESELRAAAKNFFKEVVEPRIFTEFQVLTSELAARGCELWAVSSTNNWVVEEGAKRFGIPAEHVLAACVVFEGGIATDRLARVPSDEFKAVAIREVIARPVDAVFGNSVHDLAMLEIAKTPYAINPNPDLAAIAVERGWTVYWPGN
jgi:phosphoserine phosphatase